MKTLTESIPTVFNPETVFVLSVRKGDEKSGRAEEPLIAHRVMPPAGDNSIQDGFPWSAIHE